LPQNHNMTNFLSYFLVLLIVLFSCNTNKNLSERHNTEGQEEKRIVTGAEQMDILLPLLSGKRVGIVTNHTSLVSGTHLVDTLLSEGIRVAAIFSPEHGFRGDADAGMLLENTIDSLTGLPIISLYGKNRKPASEDMENIDIMVFDIQDVGVRYYTYTSTMHYVMEACAEKNISFLVLDRPNPNGFYVDGPVLDMQYKSFVGMHPVALVHGMTVAEYALMVNSEGWLSAGKACKLLYVKCKNYTHSDYYELPVHPSPNLKDMRAIYLYPSLGIFEGTVMSVGRGTPYPFKVIGHPEFLIRDFHFVPEPIQGEAVNPKLKGETCYGIDLRDIPLDSLRKRRQIDLSYIIKAHENMPEHISFFNSFFINLTGDTALKKQIEQGESEDVIRASWEPALGEFKKLRKQYLLYSE
jgi:uncharacterized protein YbbC (DUF1343 family)